MLVICVCSWGWQQAALHVSFGSSRLIWKLIQQAALHGKALGLELLEDGRLLWAGLTRLRCAWVRGVYVVWVYVD